jgi:RNA polymerase sigma-70 factor (ECF subfamily)
MSHTALELRNTTAPLSDEEVVRRVLDGETALFELIMRRYNQRLYRVARAILRDDGEAEDVMQDAYVRAYEHLGSFRGEARFSTWLTRIAVHEALARTRRARRFAPLDEHQQESDVMSSERTSRPDQQLLERELGELLDRAIDGLPEEFRLVFVLRVIEEMSGADTAEALGLPEQTVKTRLFRARERIKRELLTHFDAQPEAAYAFHLTRCDRVVRAVMTLLAHGTDTSEA